MEQTLGNIDGARSVFERWMYVTSIYELHARHILTPTLRQWEPEEAAWSSYIKLELRHGEFEKCRGIYERFTVVHPAPRIWIKWASFEEEHGTSDLVRDVFGTAVTTLGDDFMDERLFIAYARFETKMKEIERARAIYKFALDRMPRSKSVNLHKAFTQFEKQFGNKEGIENVILSKRRVHYENELKENPKNYDAWIDFARLEETAGNQDRVREVYERAIAQIPPTQEKRHWRRYVYLWLFYAVYSETVSRDIERARQIYQECIRLLPHKTFTFSKIWLMFAHFEIRQGQLSTARKLLGKSLGISPKGATFKGYIELEMKLFEFTRCRKLYEKYIEWNGSNCQTWIKFAELERGLDDLDRTRAIFELAVDEPQLDMPEMAWKAYIDFEEGEGEYDRTRALYERLLQKTSNCKVWISWAQLELGIPDPSSSEDDDTISPSAISRARSIFTRAHTVLKDKDLKEDRVALLSAWKSFEDVHGSEADKDNIAKQMPRKVKKRRKLDDDSFEEYVDYVFPADDESASKLTRLLANAAKWKAAKAAQEAAQEGSAE
jgi:crooked neck